MEKIKKFIRSDAWIVLFDIIAVNGAYLLAILIRFYVHFKFTSGVGDFREYYLQFTPYYTVLCVIVFFICGLYDGMWRYAGLSDMNRIIGANLITAVIQVAGTNLFVHRMPTSYYLIGGFLQFFLIVVIRFSYRFLQTRRERSEKQKAWSIPALVVGSDENARRFIHYLDGNTPYQVAVIAGENSGRSLDGIPIVDYGSIPVQSGLYGVKTIFVADDSLDEARRKELAQATGAEVRDAREYLRGQSSGLSMYTLQPLLDGPVTVVVDGVERKLEASNESLATFMGFYEVKRIQGARIELKSREAWDGGTEA